MDVGEGWNGTSNVTEDIAVVYLTAEGDGSVFMQAEDNDDCFLEVKACELHTACATYAVNGFLAVRPATQAHRARRGQGPRAPGRHPQVLERMSEWVGILKRSGCWRGLEYKLERVGVDVVIGYAIRNYCVL